MCIRDSYLGVTSQSAYSVTSSDSYFIFQCIEGYNSADLAFGSANAKSVTISFWVRSSLTGTFGGSLKSSADSRTYPFTYAISSANTWEQKSITIAGDTSGTWLTNNGAGLYLCFALGVGSAQSGTAGSWASTNYSSATGATSVVGTNGATFYITGVQLEAGSVATPFERRSYGQELALCQRYYETGVTGANGGLGAYSGYLGAYVAYKATKRATATLTQSSQTYSSIYNNTIYLGSTLAATYTINDTNGFYHNAINNSNGTAYVFTYTATAEL